MGQLEALIRSATNGRVISNFVFVVEMVGSEGADIEIFVSETMTPWLAGGMLGYAGDLILDKFFSERFDGDD